MKKDLEFANVWFVIPVRKGSKGVPFKNRKLLPFTLEAIPCELRKRVIISTDDKWIKAEAMCRGLILHERREELSGDAVDIKSVMESVVIDCEIPRTATVIMLYVVWPDRDLELIKRALSEYLNADVRSLLCATPVRSHPYMAFTWGQENRGIPVVKHNLFRRQDYPDCFVINHIVTIFSVDELKFLNEQLYNSKTFFFPVHEELNIDEQEDMDLFLERADQNN